MRRAYNIIQGLELLLRKLRTMRFPIISVSPLELTTHQLDNLTHAQRRLILE